MNLADLGVVYAIAGAACAVAVYRSSTGPRASALAQAAISVVLWPVWAPLALTSSKRKREPAPAATRPTPGATMDPAVARVEATLAEAVAACAGTPLETLLTAEAAARIAGEMRRAATRHAEVVATLADPSLAPAAVEARVAALEAEGGSERALATARLHRDSARRLIALRDRDARALAELAELVAALKTQLWLARVAGSSDASPTDLVTELWARVEGLDAATNEPEERA